MNSRWKKSKLLYLNQTTLDLCLYVRFSFNIQRTKEPILWMLRTSPWRCQDSGVHCQVTNLITSSKACTLQLACCQTQRQRQRCSSPSLNLIKPHPKRAVCNRPMTGPVFTPFSSAEKIHCRTCRRSLWPQCHAAELRFWRRVAGFCGNFQFREDWWSSVGRMEVGQTDQTGAVKKKVICWRNWRQMGFKSQNAVVTW